MKASRKGNAGSFQKGDQRINKHGPVSRDRQAWVTEFNNGLAKKADPNKLIDKLVELAEAGVEWAMKEVFDRILGKVTQPIGGDGGGPIQHVLKFDFGENGNGKADE